MKAPRFFLGAVLLFWGWQYEHLLTGIGLGLVLEFLSYYKVRLDFKTADFNRFVDVSIVLLAGAVVVALSTDAKKAIYFLVQWLPVIFFPIILSQQLSMAGQINVRAFFLVGKKKRNLQMHDPGKIDVSYIYALLCLLSSGMLKENGQLFFMASCLFFLWAFFHIRPRRFHIGIWMVSIVLIFSSAYISYKGIRYTRMKISRWLMATYMDYYSANPFKNSLALNEIGELKLSDKIVLRVAYPGEIPKEKMLIQNATYDTFAISTWYSRSPFERILPLREKDFLQVQPPVESTREMTIYSRLFRNRAVLYLPQGTISISGIKAGVCEKNAMQSVRIKGGPSYVKTVVNYTGKLSHDPEPEKRDLFISSKDREAVRYMVETIGLGNRPPEEVLRLVKTYFSENFAYSLELKGKGDFETPLQNFLLNTKTGHCELFATATALILRAAGIPARYVTGFIVHEYSGLEKRMLVRQRDAHAWVKAFINGAWINLDTTPPESFEVDMERSDPSFLMDLFSFLGFSVSQLRHETGEKLMEKYGLWLVLPLVVILFLRLRKAGAVKRVAEQIKEDKKISETVRSAQFYDIEKLLAQKGFPRQPAETYNAWSCRIADRFEEITERQRFFFVLSLYHKWRFSRNGLRESEKNRFDTQADMVLEQINNRF